MPTRISSSGLLPWKSGTALIVRWPRIQITWDVGFWDFRGKLSTWKKMKTVKPLIYRHWFMNSLVTMCYWVCSFAEWRGVFHISCIFFGPQSSISRIVQTTLLFLWQFLPLLHAILPEKIFVFAKLANMFLDMGFKGFSENSPPNLAWSLCWFISLSEGCLSWLTRFPLFWGTFTFCLLGLGTVAGLLRCLLGRLFFLGYLFRLLLRRLLCFLLCFLFRGCLLLLLAGSFHLFPIALLTTSPLLWGSLHFGGSFSFRLSFGFRLLIMIFFTFPLSGLGLCCLTFPGPQRFLELLLSISPKAVLLGQWCGKMFEPYGLYTNTLTRYLLTICPLKEISQTKTNHSFVSAIATNEGLKYGVASGGTVVLLAGVPEGSSDLVGSTRSFSVFAESTSTSAWVGPVGPSSFDSSGFESSSATPVASGSAVSVPGRRGLVKSGQGFEESLEYNIQWIRKFISSLQSWE